MFLPIGSVRLSNKRRWNIKSLLPPLCFLYFIIGRNTVFSIRMRTLTMVSDSMSLCRPPWVIRFGLVCTSNMLTWPDMVLIWTKVNFPEIRDISVKIWKPDELERFITIHILCLPIDVLGRKDKLFLRGSYARYRTLEKMCKHFLVRKYPVYPKNALRWYLFLRTCNAGIFVHTFWSQVDSLPVQTDRLTGPHDIFDNL